MTPEQIAKLQADLAAATLRADTAETALKAANDGKSKAEGLAAAEKTRADTAASALKARTDADELATVSAVAAKVIGKTFKADGKTAAQIKAEVIAAKRPTLKLDGKDASFVDGVFESVAADAPRADNAQELRSAVRPIVETETRADAAPLTSEQKRVKMIADGDARYLVAKEAAAKGAK